MNASRTWFFNLTLVTALGFSGCQMPMRPAEPDQAAVGARVSRPGEPSRVSGRLTPRLLTQAPTAAWSGSPIWMLPTVQTGRRRESKMEAKTEGGVCDGLF